MVRKYAHYVVWSLELITHMSHKYWALDIEVVAKCPQSSKKHDQNWQQKGMRSSLHLHTVSDKGIHLSL